METGKDRLSFWITEEGFQQDETIWTSEKGEESWFGRFHANRYQALYELGFVPCPEEMDASGHFLYRIADGFFHELTSMPDLELLRDQASVEMDSILEEELLVAVPFIPGNEYVTGEWLRLQFQRLNRIFSQEIRVFEGTVALYLAGKSQSLKLAERIFFHLVESGDEEYPFAFLATYSTKNEEGNIRHVPLQHALIEYKQDRNKLLELLSCLNQASEVSPLIGEFVEKGEMFHPLRLSSGEAYEILRDVPAIEEKGIVCRIPNWWRKHAAQMSLSVKLGEEKESMLGMDTILTMTPELTVDGVPLTEEEIRRLLSESEGLALLKGKWVEVDHARLKELLKLMEKYHGDLTLMEALRMGLRTDHDTNADLGPKVTNGKWLGEFLLKLRSPQNIQKPKLPESFQGVLRPYQQNGFAWLDYMGEMGLGACLADDMGLGKTVQVLAFLERLRQKAPDAAVLLVVPASLIGNWQKEAEKFAPEMSVYILHGRPAKELAVELDEETAFLTITTYGMASRIPGFEEYGWDCLILDEAQAIKNPMTKQTRLIKRIPATIRIAMTGTPIENDLTNLWSLFDFLDKGLLGSSGEFGDYCKGLQAHPEGYSRLKNMIAPFMLRRVKTDKSIISDLPEKLEQVDYVDFSKKQKVLYRKYVNGLAEKIGGLSGMERRGLILASLTKLKQICNHPDQYLGQETYAEKDSGKLELLRDICETIYQKRERVLVFTQFKEITEALDRFLFGIFHAKGYVIHGGTRVSRRTEIVEAFQGEDYVPYIVLSVKAGGTGLNLTKANHVIHFDRWWNPAVENQATDRAFRIGQKKNVMVHKFVSRGTIEEKIDALIESKKELAQNVIGAGGESWLTELGNDELEQLFSLDT